MLKTRSLEESNSVKIEAFLNEWPEEVVQTVHAILNQHKQENEWLRMAELKKALAWLWPNLRATTVLGHFVLATTIENQTLLTVTLGWNAGAHHQDVANVDTFMPLYTRKLEKMGFRYDCLSFPLPSDEKTARPRKPHPRMETLKKLQDLVAYRARHIEPNFVGIDKMQACADMHLALKTVKKYAPILYERWYDPGYAGEVQ